MADDEGADIVFDKAFRAEKIEKDAAYIAELEARVRELEPIVRNLLAWWDNENAGPDYGNQTRDTHPDGERIWREWWDRNLRLCDATHEMARRALNKERACCRKCGAEMRPGIAMGQTYTAGVPDFPGDDYSSTFSAGGPGRVMECLKCPECGWSVEKADE